MVLRFDPTENHIVKVNELRDFLHMFLLRSLFLRVDLNASVAASGFEVLQEYNGTTALNFEEFNDWSSRGLGQNVRSDEFRP